MKRRNNRSIVWLVVVVLVAWAGYALPSGYYALFPGNALSVDRMIHVEDGAKDADGAFYLTTISSREASLFVYAYALINPRVSLRTREEYLPPGMDMEEYNRYSQRLMEESQATAIVVALRALGYDARLTGEGVRVVEVMSDGPARNRLFSDDVINGVDGTPTLTTDDLTGFMAATEVGTRVVFAVSRDGNEVEVPLVTVEHPTAKGRSAVRIRIETLNPSYESPVQVRIEPGNITGPSAGLMFVLEIMNQGDMLRDLTHGKQIAGTGTISSSGSVGAVGGVAQKVAAAERAGAEYFLVPMENLSEALSSARAIKVVGVSSLEDALMFLESLDG